MVLVLTVIPTELELGQNDDCQNDGLFQRSPPDLVLAGGTRCEAIILTSIILTKNR